MPKTIKINSCGECPYRTQGTKPNNCLMLGYGKVNPSTIHENCPLEDVVDYRDLIIFLCSVVAEMREAQIRAFSRDTLNETRDDLMMRFPVIQGMNNQKKIKMVGALDHQKINGKIFDKLIESDVK